MGPGIISHGAFLRALPVGSHICQFYHQRLDLYEGVLQFLRTGLEANECCLWMTTEPLGLAELRRCLQADLPGFDDYVQRGQLELIESRDWYFDRSGALLPGDVLIAKIEDKLERAIQRGFKYLRGSGQIGRLEIDWKAVLDYEQRVQQLMASAPVRAHCAHSLVHSPMAILSEVMAYHDLSFYQKGDRWEILSPLDW